MKQFLYLFIFTTLCFSGFSQQKDISLDWAKEPVFEHFLSNKKTPAVINASNYINNSNYYECNFEWIQENTLISNLKLTNIIFKDIDNTTLGDLTKENIPDKLFYQFSSNKGRDILYTGVRVTPIIFEEGRYKKLISFSITSSKNTLKSKKNILNRSEKSTTTSIKNSVLATGQWVKFAIDTSGVYKITPQFLTEIGLNLNGANANNIKIYGNGGAPLPYKNSDTEFYDIPENPIEIVGAEDGVFSGNDFILFYAQGNQNFNAENRSFINPYSDQAFYYVTIGNSRSKRITTLNEPSNTPSAILDEYDFETFYEKDLTNIGGIGRIWHGDEFDVITNRNYQFFIPDVKKINLGDDLITPIDVSIPFSAVYSVNPSLIVNSNQTNNPLTFPFNQSAPESGTSSHRELSRRLNTGEPRPLFNLTNFKGNTLNLSLTFDKSTDPSNIGYLDYISIKTKCLLKDYGKQFTFSNITQQSANNSVQFRITNATNISAIWDITNPYEISKKDHNSSGILTFNAPIGNTNKYVSINKNDIYAPRKVENSNVQNQDLKGSFFTNNGNNKQFIDLDYLIITTPEFFNAANKLANFRKNNDGFNVKIVTPNTIYNEFSTGKQDITAIRNFIKFLYDNASRPDKKLKYVCIIGDGSYDYKDRIRNNTNIVPLYHSIESISFATGFSSDDYYGMMDENEGANLLTDKLDIAIGRIVAPTPQIADDVINKTIRSYSIDSYGAWRKNILFISDDVDRRAASSDVDGQIELKLDFVAEQLKAKNPDFNVKKIFCDAFRQVTSSGGSRYPEANQQILNNFETGSALINYFGHGGESGIASEFIFSALEASELSNTNRLPVFITLTCELTRFDNPSRRTAGELMFWNRNGGAVALITTTRNLFVRVGLNLNPILSNALFDDNGNAIAIGEALRVAKNNTLTSGGNHRTVFCIGDPALKIAFPKPKINLTKTLKLINAEGQDIFVEITNIVNDPITGGKKLIIRDNSGNPIREVAINSTIEASLSALDRVKIQGEVVDSNSNTLLKNYNGRTTITLFDKDISKQTLGNDGNTTCWEIPDQTTGNITRCADNGLFTIEFIESGGIVFNGQATVSNGLFEIEFILPKNVKLPLGEGKVSMYSQNSQRLEDQTGFKNVEIGGLNTEAPEDLTPPIINIFFNDENFISGQIVNPSPTLIVKFSDNSGINTASGAGHDIIAIIDDDEKNPINLNEHYITDLDNFTKGSLNFELRNLSTGTHTIKIRASDTHNNVSFQEVSFEVREASEFLIDRVLNYPNPFVSYTEFWFSHNSSPQDTLEVMLQVLTISGKIVTSKYATLSGSTTYRGAIKWDGKDNFGDKIGKGVYIYKITVKSTLLEKTTSKIEKLVIL